MLRILYMCSRGAGFMEITNGRGCVEHGQLGRLPANTSDSCAASPLQPAQKEKRK
jgi:hypothetical protein